MHVCMCLGMNRDRRLTVLQQLESVVEGVFSLGLVGDQWCGEIISELVVGAKRYS